MITLSVAFLAITTIFLSVANMRLSKRIARLEASEVQRRIWGG